MEPPYDDEYDDEQYDDDRRDDGVDDPPSGGSKGIVIGALVLLLVIAGAVVALVAAGSDDDADSVAEVPSTSTTVRRTTSTTSASTTTTGVDITTTTTVAGSTTTTVAGTTSTTKPSSGNTTAPGTNARFDALWNSCRDGSMQDCDRLYSQSEPGSAYSAFGDTCGNRKAAGGGYCVKKADIPQSFGDDPYLDGLQDRCKAGEYGACDQLYLDAYPGTPYEQVGATCGGKDPAGGGRCATRYGTVVKD